MSYLGTGATLVVSIDLEFDVDVDNDGISYFAVSLFLDDVEKGQII